MLKSKYLRQSQRSEPAQLKAGLLFRKEGDLSARTTPREEVPSPSEPAAAPAAAPAGAPAEAFAPRARAPPGAAGEVSDGDGWLRTRCKWCVRFILSPATSWCVKFILWRTVFGVCFLAELESIPLSGYARKKR